MCCHVTRFNQGLSLSRWGGKKRDPGNEVALARARKIFATARMLAFSLTCAQHSRPQSRLVLLAAGGWARGPSAFGDTGLRKS